MRGVWVVAVVAGCYNPTDLPCHVTCDDVGGCPAGLECAGPNRLCEPSPGACTEPPPDAMPCTGTIVGTGVVRVCVDAVPDMAAFDGGVIDTNADCTQMAVTTENITVCVIVAASIKLSASITVRGDFPLVLLGTDQIGLTVGAILDASSGLAKIGPGASLDDCATPSGSSGHNGASGAPGGRFHGVAGDGGPGSAINAMTVTPAALTEPTAIFRAGCRGGNGGNNLINELGGAGGRPGGAVYLLSNGAITLDMGSTINASGAGGGLALRLSGGGGGGSGGFIGLDAPMLAIAATAQLFALGGSGSTGGGENFDGTPGSSATSASAPAPASTNPCGGPGGGGSDRTVGGKPGTKGTCPSGMDGGGGGGGNGRIMSSGPLVGATAAKINPDPERL